MNLYNDSGECRHPPYGGCGLKLFGTIFVRLHNQSPSIRRVWIEIAENAIDYRKCFVTLHTEGVDWNRWNIDSCIYRLRVTLHTEGVDWNRWIGGICHALPLVTLHTEGVDWNFWHYRYLLKSYLSPSIRRVWIEIDIVIMFFSFYQSPSIRRVWIEIYADLLDYAEKHGHPPYGGCGLKFFCKLVFLIVSIVTLHTEGVDWNTTAIKTYGDVGASPSIRRVWIEISQFRKLTFPYNRHPPYGGCGLKLFSLPLYDVVWTCHPPYGGCGLK